MKKFSGKTLAAVLSCLLLWTGPAHSQGPPLQVQAVVKGTALLPCDINPPLANDSYILVIWFKNEMTPIYSYDVRKGQSERASHWHDGDLLEERAYFRTITEPATLSLDNVDERDQGDYRCRVDFRKSPTRNTRVRLTVIVPPQKPTIIDDRGKEVPSVAGPYVEGSEMKLTCIVPGGKPAPTVRWWRGELLQESKTMPTAFPSVWNNQLVIKSLSRGDLHAVFTCQASNNNISQPVSASVSIEMHFKPISATILSSNAPYSADRKYELVCQSLGSRPPAKITWWMDNRQLENAEQKVSPDGNVTTSTLTFTPKSEDNGKAITCRAKNPLLHAGVEEDTNKLNVFFLPKLELKLGVNLNPDDIEEGDDVYFECKVFANPPAYKVSWKHNGQLVQHNQKMGIIMNQQNLALQKVRRQQAGNYTCIASNVEGDSESQPVVLNVMYAPSCRPEQKRVYGAARGETTRVLCEVVAFPIPEAFKWSFNNTAELVDVPQSQITTNESQSMLTYAPTTELDYGTVLCWATNYVGMQREPCVFHIIAAGHPDTPYNCSLLNQTTESLEVECMEGFDGGQPQWFQLEVFDLHTGHLQANVSAKFPVFTVGGLGAGKVLKMLVYAVNAKGRSDPQLLEGFTLKVAEKQTGTPTPFDMTTTLGALVSVVVLLLLVVFIIAGVLQIRRRHRAQSPARPADLPIKEKAALPLRSNLDDMYDMDDKNPDVIPCNKDSDYQVVSGARTPGMNNQTPTELPAYEDHQKRNNVTRNGDLYENYKNNRERFPPHAGVRDEVTYAELCLSTAGGSRAPREEPVVYAQIDHSRRPPPLASPPPREIVTVRTPLMATQQESCV